VIRYKPKISGSFTAVQLKKPLGASATDWLIITEDGNVTVVGNDEFRAFYELDRNPPTPIKVTQKKPLRRAHRDDTQVTGDRRPPRTGANTELPPNLGRSITGFVMRVLRAMSTESPMTLATLSMVIERVKKLADGEVFVFKPTSISPSLSRLMQAGYVDCTTDTRERRYAITVLGMERLKDWEERSKGTK